MIGVEAYPVLVLRQKLGWSVVVLFVKSVAQPVETIVYTLTYLTDRTTILDQNLYETALLEGEVVNYFKESLCIRSVVLLVEIIKMQTVKDIKKLTQSIKYDSISWYSVDVSTQLIWKYKINNFPKFFCLIKIQFFF